MTEINATQPQLSARGVRASFAALILAALGDYLLPDISPGLNFFVFALAVAIAVIAVAAPRGNWRSLSILLLLALAAALPLIEAPSLFGLFTASMGLAVLALGAAYLLPQHWTGLPGVMLRFLLLAPLRFIDDAIRFSTVGLARQLAQVLSRGVLVWIVPAVFAVIFLLLFASANPIIESALGHLNIDALFNTLGSLHIVVWAIIIVMVWPLLLPRLKRWSARAAPSEKPEGPESLLFGRAAILRSLIVFNLLFATQTLLDLTFLWGGADLPDGMSHADYAHRGAYPLIVTALLAAAFVLAAMRPGGAGETSRPIRLLVYAWIAQNIMLCISSILRLDLYVEVYSLTELRVAAGIWMGLVAIGLLLILLRIALRRSNDWLISCNCAVLTLTLYICAFVDFPAFIAGFNVEHSREISGQGQLLDVEYLRDLGPSALPALDRYIAAIPANVRHIRDELAQEALSPTADWRSWTFRRERQRQYAAQHPIASAARSDNN